MAAPDTFLEIHEMQTEKRRVALNSLYVAIVITVLKLIVGLSTHSLGILSEAAHSALDLVAAFVTLISVRVSDKPADADHQYGHGKVENFSAFIETGLLVLTAVWILWEAIRRLLYHDVHIKPTAAAFAVMAFSMVLDYWRSRSLTKIARKYESQALQADALHFSTDIWSSGVVIIGLALAVIGNKFNIFALRNADPLCRFSDPTARPQAHAAWTAGPADPAPASRRTTAPHLQRRASWGRAYRELS